MRLSVNFIYFGEKLGGWLFRAARRCPGGDRWSYRARSGSPWAIARRPGS
jgi:hypothetical protein